MAKMTLGGFVFGHGSNSVSYSYGMNTTTQATYGGGVIQLLSVYIDTVTVTGEFNGFDEMRAFEKFFISAMQKQQSTGKSIVFSFPPNWSDMAVFVQSFPSVSYSNTVAAPTYQITLIPEDGNAAVEAIGKSSVTAKALAAIADGVNWVSNKYNNPTADSTSLTAEINDISTPLGLASTQPSAPAAPSNGVPTGQGSGFDLNTGVVLPSTSPGSTPTP